VNEIVMKRISEKTYARVLVRIHLNVLNVWTSSTIVPTGNLAFTLIYKKGRVEQMRNEFNWITNLDIDCSHSNHQFIVWMRIGNFQLKWNFFIFLRRWRGRRRGRRGRRRGGRRRRRRWRWRRRWWRRRRRWRRQYITFSTNLNQIQIKNEIRTTNNAINWTLSVVSSNKRRQTNALIGQLTTNTRFSFLTTNATWFIGTTCSITSVAAYMIELWCWKFIVWDHNINQPSHSADDETWRQPLSAVQQAPNNNNNIK
jgi:hypothetical protein